MHNKQPAGCAISGGGTTNIVLPDSERHACVRDGGVGRWTCAGSDIFCGTVDTHLAQRNFALGQVPRALGLFFLGRFSCERAGRALPRRLANPDSGRRDSSRQSSPSLLWLAPAALRCRELLWVL